MQNKYWLGFAIGIPIGLACYFAVIASLPALGKNTWIVLENKATAVAGAPKKY